METLKPFNKHETDSRPNSKLETLMAVLITIAVIIVHTVLLCAFCIFLTY